MARIKACYPLSVLCLRLALFFSLISLVGSCAADDEQIVSPASGAKSGYYDVRLVPPGLTPAEIVEVRFGGIKAYDLRVDDAALQVTIQGHPHSGPVDIELDTETGSQVLPDAFEYLPALDPRFERIAAVGASLSQGVQNGVPTAHGGLYSPPAQLARQLQGYMPLPILVDPLFPEMTVDDIGPPPACDRPSIESFVVMSAGDALDVLLRGFQHGRVDPELEAHNVAVGGFKLENVLRGPSMDVIGGDFIARLVYSPLEDPTDTQLDIVEDLHPTLIVSTDLYGNDAIAPFVSGSGIRLEESTPLEQFEPDLQETIERLAATGAEVFVANIPRPSLLPVALAKKRSLIEDAVAAAREAGEDEARAAFDSEQLADEAIQAVDTRARAYNDLLETFVARYTNVHVVDMAARTEEVEMDGLLVSGTTLTVKKFGGLLGLDSIHFTDTGYAFLANLFVSAINDVLGTAVPEIDLTAVLANDRSSPKVLAEMGFDPTLCER